MNKYYWITAKDGKDALFDGRVLKNNSGAALKSVTERIGRPLSKGIATSVYELPIPLLSEIVADVFSRHPNGEVPSPEPPSPEPPDAITPEAIPEASRLRFLVTLRKQISQAKNWPRKPDPNLEITPPPHGWLLPILLECESRCWGRWDHWFRTMEAGRILDEPIPQIDFEPHNATLARKMHEKALDSITRSGSWQGWGSWNNFDYYMDWLLYAFGDSHQKEPPVEPETGAFSRLYQVFCLEAMIAWPADLFGELLAENKHGRGNGFYPTPHCAVELMMRMTIPQDGNQRTQTVCDPCLGTGRMLLHASNHSYRLYGQDINGTVIKAALVNGYCFAPWMVRAFPFLDDPKRK